MDYEPFQSLADSSGLTVDRINYVVCLLAAYPLAAVFKLIPAKQVALRHLVGGLLGVAFGFLCFRWQILHTVFCGAITYLMLHVESIRKQPEIPFYFSMAYLVLMHAWRQYWDFGGYVLDITGPHMILTQKLSSLAFDLRDGAVDPKTIEESQRIRALKKVPTALELFGHVFLFTSYLAGPTHTFADYMAFIEDQHHAPSGLVVALKKFLFAFLCYAIKFIPGQLGVPSDYMYLMNDTAAQNWNLGRKLLHVYVAAVCTRAQYYFAWILSEGANNLAGLGYRPSPAGTDPWSSISNVNVLKVEGAENLKMVLDNWNIQTQVWLKHVMYVRCKNQAVLKTMLLSALWHGLYPGYFLTFISAWIITEAARKVRRVIRPLFLDSAPKKMFYDVVGLLATQFFLNYMVVPFVMLALGSSIDYWLALYFVGHLIAIPAYLFLPNKSEGGARPPKQPAQGADEAKKTE